MLNSFPNIHIYDLPFKNIISIKLNKSFLKLLLKSLKSKYKNRRTIYNKLNTSLTYQSFSSYLNISFKHFRSLDVMSKLCELGEMPLEELEKNIVGYRTVRGRITIIKPKLPIEVNPIFDMLIVHLMADGCCIKFKDKRTIYYCYRQFNEFFRNIFIKKSEIVFGNLCFQRDYFDKMRGVYLPEVLTLILLWYYDLKPENFLTEKARIPQVFFSKSKDFLLATILAFIIDEGNIDSSGICIRLKNKNLILDLQKIAKELNYSSRVSRDKEMWVLYLNAESTRKLYFDYIELKRIYNEVSLGIKEEKLKLIIERENKEWKNLGEGMVKNKIVDLLKSKDKSIKELSSALNITRQGIRYHINELRELNVIRTENVKKNYVCKLIKEKHFEEKKIGRSRPIGKTKKEILELLSNVNLNTIELSNLIKIKPNNIRQQLWNLENENKIRRDGKDGKKIIWSISNLKV